MSVPATIAHMITRMPDNVSFNYPLPLLLHSQMPPFVRLLVLLLFPSLLLLFPINRPGPLLLSTSNHFTAGHGSSKPQRDMSVKKRDEERKEGDLLKTSCLSLFLLSRRCRGRVGCCCTCSQGAVRAPPTLRSP